MSFKHSQLVIDHSQTRGPERAIMLALAFRADEGGECWPSLPRIAKDAGLTRRTVTRCLPRIEAAGELSIEHRGRTVPTFGGKQATNVYRITIAPPREGGDRLTPPSPGKGGPRSPHGGDGESEKAGTDSPEGGDRRTPESSENPHREPSENRQRRVGLSGQQVDYEREEVPTPADYGGDMASLIHNCPNPILAAMAVTGERRKPAWGYWVKVLNRAREAHGTDRAERLFRGCLDELHGEMKAGEIRNPGACLNAKLRKELRPA